MIILGIIIGILAIIWFSFEVAQYKVWAAYEIKKDLDEVKKHEKEFADSIVEYIENTWEESFEDEFIIGCDESGHEEITLEKRFLIDLIRKSFSIGEMEFHSKVRIRVRKGAILIERIYDKGEIL